jgi:hypothetical protein
MLSQYFFGYPPHHEKLSSSRCSFIQKPLMTVPASDAKTTYGEESAVGDITVVAMKTVLNGLK